MKPTETSAAIARSGASAKTILALFPPSSRLTRFKFELAAAVMIWRPTSPEPVKVMQSTS